MLLEGRRVLVTGCATERGIGRALIELASANGAETIALDLSFESGSLEAWDVAPRCYRIRCDVTQDADCDAVAAAVNASGQLDALVHCAGVAEPLAISELTRERYQKVMDANLWGAMRLTQILLPALRKSDRGAVVCVSSVAGQRGGGFVGGLHYAASKAGVLGFVRGLARELAPDGIRVNAVSPGLVDTDMTTPFMAPELRAELAAQTPMRRLAAASEIASVCMFLASDLSSYVTGATIDVNGGLHIH